MSSNPFNAIVDRVNLKHIVLDGGVYSVVVQHKDDPTHFNLYAVAAAFPTAKLCMSEALEQFPTANVYVFTRSRAKINEVSKVER